MAKGAEFEERAVAFLETLFKRLGFQVIEARRQGAGTQNGFDLLIRFLDDGGAERGFFFECKNYTNPLSWNDISVKINQIGASGHRPDCFTAISPHVDFSNIDVNVLADQERRYGFPIKYWTPQAFVKEYFSVDADFFEYVYGEQCAVGEPEKTSIVEKIKAMVGAALQQKDAMPVPVAFHKELTNKLPRINETDIIGRSEELEELNQLLFDNKQVVVVNGLGGIGKTTLAQAYVSKYYDSYDHIVWVTQLTDAITNDINSAEGLAENLFIATQGKDQQQLFQEIVRCLKALSGTGLLVLDNADEKLSKLKTYLPGQPHWHLLATSREHIDGFYLKELEFLSPDKAIELFKKHCFLITDEKEIACIVEAVDYHTLTIEILAKTAQYHRTDISKLKSAIREGLTANISVPHKEDGGKIANVRSYLTSIFSLSDLGEDEIWLMKQFACLPTEFHVYDKLLELIEPDGDKKEQFAGLCNSLVEQGWLLYNKNADAYKMHMVVQDVTAQQIKIAVEDIGRLMENITERLKIDYAKDNPVDRFQWIPFGDAILTNFQDDASTDFSLLQIRLASGLQDQGRYVQALELLRKAAATREKELGVDHSLTVAIYSNLALVLQDLGRYEEARDLLEEVVASDEENFGIDHPAIAINYSNLALVLQDLGQYEEARDLLEKVIASDEENLGIDHSAIAINYSNLALVLQDLGEYEQARELLEKAVASAEKNLGVDHPKTATRYSNLASILQDLGQYEDALNLLQKAKQSDEKTFGTDHPTTAIHYSNLANLLQVMGKYAEAFEYSKKALLIFKKALPEGHPYINTVQEIYDDIQSHL